VKLLTFEKACKYSNFKKPLKCCSQTDLKIFNNKKRFSHDFSSQFFPLFPSYVTVIISQSAAAPRQRPSNYGERKNVHVHTQKKESCATAH
jgi:hypothetical protein